jgi:hypothetical protein
MRTTSVLAGLGAAAVLLPAGAATAQAAPLAAIDRVGFVASGPALSGDRVAYGVGTSFATRFDLLGATLGRGGPATLFSTTPSRKGEMLNGGVVAASPTRTAFTFDRIGSDAETPSSQQVFSGGPTGPFAATAGAADGSTVVDEVDLAVGPAPAKEYPGVIEARIAGDLVALARRTSDTVTRVTVTNWRTGADLYVVDVPTTAPYGFGFGLDVQEDGTVAVRAANPASTGSRPKVDVAWASAAEPTLHPVAQDVGTLVLRIDDGTILFERAHGTARRELAVADLAGTVRAASFPVGFVRGADLDGGRLAFATTTCVYAGDVPAAAPAFAPAGTCPQASLQFRTVATRTRGRVQVKLTCEMASSRGCAGRITLQTPKAKGRKVVSLGTRGFTQPAGSTRTYTVRLSSAGLRTIRGRVGSRRRTAIIDVLARATDDAGLTSSTRRDALVRLK